MKYFFFVFSFFIVRTAAAFSASSEWLAVGHYQPSGSGFESTIDSDNFFLSSEGKVSPDKELAATIALFEGNDTEKQCLFPARYKLLHKAGLIKKPFPRCEEYEQLKKDLQPSGVTLLFTDAYMNNPSSLFGHTLMRVDTARKGTQLLAHGVNYGAFTDGQENSVLFAVYGLTGGYYGGFTIKPYYDIINTYNNIENRDIWEFQLDLSEEELDFFVAHMWEVGHAQSKYYFFTRNCSYMLMEVLDAVRPSLQLAKEFPVQAIPLDTVKAVQARKGLVKSVNYRPSRQVKIRHRYKNMNDEEKKAYLKAIKKQDFEIGLDDEKAKADVLETAYQYVQYQYVAKDLELDDYRRRSFQALVARNKIRETGNIEELKDGKSPLATHESMRASAGFGFRNGEAFQEIVFRPAYHSLTDDNYGFLRGAEINFLNAAFRHYDNRNKTVLQKFDLVGIKSLSPTDEMFMPVSYAVDINAGREFNPETGEEGYVLNAAVGAGATLALSDEIWVYGMGNSYASYGGFLPDNYWLGIGAAAGVYADFGKWRFLGEAEKVFATSDIADKIKYKAEAVYTLSRNNAAALNFTYHQNHGKNLNEYMLSWRHYF